MTEDTEVRFQRINSLLEESDKNRRKQGLEIIRDMVLQNKHQDEDEFIQVWEAFNKPLARILNDPVEVCREMCVDIMKNFILSLPVQEKNISYIIPILARRLGSQELLESSEEIRLSCISFIRVIMNKYRNHLNCYFEDLATILTRTVTDNYPNVKRESCQAISELAKIMPRYFYDHSQSFVKGILGNFTHQHYRVRMASVYTIGEVLLHGKSIIMEQVAGPMAQRLFDHSGAVRAAVIEVSGKWLVDLRDKYSWWYKLIPLILTGLHDEVKEIRERSAQLWDVAGTKYLEENESDQKVKDRMDFLTEKPAHYPPDIQRPNLGCRIIVQQNLGKLVNAIVMELDDWLVDVKIRSAQLLCVLVFNAEQDVTMHVEKFLPAMYRACNDQDPHVVENIEQAAKYMGYFIPPSKYCALVLLSLEDNPTPGHLRVFASILSSSEKSSLQPELPAIAKFIHDNYNHSSNNKYQTQMLSCCESLITVCKEDCAQISAELFKCIFCIMATTNVNTTKAKALLLLAELTTIENLSDINELYLKHIRTILNDIKDSCESWIVHQSEFKIFRACVSVAWCTVEDHFDIVLPILEKTTGSNSDAEIRIKVYILLSEYLTNKQVNFEDKSLANTVKSLLEKVICQGLIWSAGRAAEAIRTASVCCLCALLDKVLDKDNSKQNQDCAENELPVLIEDYSQFFNKTVPVLVGLMDDNSRMTRFYSLRAICQVVIIGRKVGVVSAEHIHTIYPVLLKRLDDGNDNVRVGAIEALQEIWRELPQDYDLEFFITHIDMVYTTTIIHLDDPETKFQNLMLDAMKNLGKVHPGLLMQKINKCRYNFRNQQGLDCLLECVRGYLGKKVESYSAEQEE